MKHVTMYGTVVLLLTMLIGTGCNTVSNEKVNKAETSVLEVDKTASNVKILFEFLKKQSGKQVMFGHQDALAYGVGWSYEKGRSDVKTLVNDYPAVVGWDLGNINFDKNLDSVPFQWMHDNIIDTYKRGGITTISWHTFNPINGANSWDTKSPVVKHLIPNGKNHADYKQLVDKVADFLTSLSTENGIKVPIIFRPFHELNGSWFWWGEKHCTSEEYKALFRFTIERLREKGVNNMLVAFSPDRMFDNETAYLERYPGDDVVDIIGVDNYYDFTQENGDSLVALRLSIVARLAEKKGKVPVFSETGQEGVTDAKWYSRLLKILKTNEETRKMAYVLVWRNYDTKHHYAPYPGHPAVDDFKRFYEDNITAFHKEAKVPYEN